MIFKRFGEVVDLGPTIFPFFLYFIYILRGAHYLFGPKYYWAQLDGPILPFTFSFSIRYVPFLLPHFTNLRSSAAVLPRISFRCSSVRNFASSPTEATAISPKNAQPLALGQFLFHFSFTSLFFISRATGLGYFIH